MTVADWFIVTVGGFALIVLFRWVGVIERYALDLHNHDINDIRERLRKLESKDKP